MHLRRRQTGSSAVMKLHEEMHKGEEPKNVCSIKGSYLQTLRRYVSEALTLNRFARVHSVMNKRLDCGKVRLPRIGVIQR